MYSGERYLSRKHFPAMFRNQAERLCQVGHRHNFACSRGAVTNQHLLACASRAPHQCHHQLDSVQLKQPVGTSPACPAFRIPLGALKSLSSSLSQCKAATGETGKLHRNFRHVAVSTAMGLKHHIVDGVMFDIPFLGHGDRWLQNLYVKYGLCQQWSIVECPQCAYIPANVSRPEPKCWIVSTQPNGEIFAFVCGCIYKRKGQQPHNRGALRHTCRCAGHRDAVNVCYWQLIACITPFPQKLVVVYAASQQIKAVLR